MNFRNYLAHIVPPWLRRYWGERLVGGGVGLYADLLMEGGAQATKASWLLANTSPDDALPRIGDERNVPKVDGETPDEYRERLHNAWELWTEAGTVTHGANVLEPWGFEPAGVSIHAWYDGDPDAFSTHWSKYWVIALDGSGYSIPFEQAVWATMPLTWGAGTTWGSSATETQVRGMCSQLWHFKSGHEIPCKLVLFYGYGGGLVWGAGGEVYDTLTASWGTDAVVIPLGSYWGADHPWGAWGTSVVPREPTVSAVWGARFHS